MTAEPPKRTFLFNLFRVYRAFVGKLTTMALKLKTLVFLLIFPLLLQGVFGIQSHAIIPVTAVTSYTALVQNQISLKDFATALKSESNSDLKGIYANGLFAF